MMQRTTYYISIENKMVEKINLPGQTELEISATEEEVEIIKKYMENEKQEQDPENEVLKNATTPASYTPVMGDDERYDQDFEKLIDLVYKLGTDETKQSLEQYR